MTGDETRIRQVLLNLIGNAIKFTDQGGVSVRVTGEMEAASHVTGGRSLVLSFAVEDTGIGIAQSQIPALFAEFEQTDDVVRRKRGGTGLGLAISRQLVRAMGGDIEVDSRVGAGSMFTARLRVGVAAGAEPMHVPYRPNVPLAVLVATNRTIEQSMLLETLTSLGASATAMTIVSDRPNVHNELRLDVVLIDADAGADVAGHLLRDIRRRAGGRRVKGVVLIDQSGRSGLTSFRAAGFDAYLIRPVRLQSLISQLDLASPGGGRIAIEADGASETSVVRAKPAMARNLLLVEDNDINALLARRMSERAGCHVTHARSGPKAIDHCESVLGRDTAPLHLVLMDIHMPEMDGFETARRIKALFAAAGRPAPPIVALTANAFAEDRKQCLEAGLDDFLAKPFERAELEALLDKWCAGPAALRSGTLDEFAA